MLSNIPVSGVVSKEDTILDKLYRIFTNRSRSVSNNPPCARSTLYNVHVFANFQSLNFHNFAAKDEISKNILDFNCLSEGKNLSKS